MRKLRGDDEWHPPMPEVDGASYLLGYLFEMGPAMAGAGGPVVISHQEIESWQRLHRIRLAPWEVKFLRRLSGEYIGQQRDAEKQSCPAPWTDEDTTQEQAAFAADALRKRLTAVAKT
jgi:hypothetical protein